MHLTINNHQLYLSFFIGIIPMDCSPSRLISSFFISVCEDRLPPRVYYLCNYPTSSLSDPPEKTFVTLLAASSLWTVMPKFSFMKPPKSRAFIFWISCVGTLWDLKLFCDIISYCCWWWRTLYVCWFSSGSKTLLLSVSSISSRT